MSELRHIETNSADDSSGRAFGLEGNLYLPVLLALMSGLVLFAVLGVLLGINYGVAATITGLPVAAVIAWVLFLKQGKPKGYDRDLIEQWLGGTNFTRIGAEQGGLVE
jgi:hypothetical protein